MMTVPVKWTLKMLGFGALLAAAFLAGQVSTFRSASLTGSSTMIRGHPTPAYASFTLSAFCEINREVEEFLNDEGGRVGLLMFMPQCFVLPEDEASYRLMFYSGNPLIEFPLELEKRTEQFVRRRLHELSIEDRQRNLVE